MLMHLRKSWVRNASSSSSQNSMWSVQKINAWFWRNLNAIIGIIVSITPKNVADYKKRAKHWSWNGMKRTQTEIHATTPGTVLVAGNEPQLENLSLKNALLMFRFLMTTVRKENIPLTYLFFYIFCCIYGLYHFNTVWFCYYNPPQVTTIDEFPAENSRRRPEMSYSIPLKPSQYCFIIRQQSLCSLQPL